VNEIKQYKHDFKHSHEGIEDDCKGFAGHGEPFTLDAVEPVGHADKDYCPERINCRVDDRAPHEK